MAIFSVLNALSDPKYLLKVLAELTLALGDDELRERVKDLDDSTRETLHALAARTADLTPGEVDDEWVESLFADEGGA